MHDLLVIAKFLVVVYLGFHCLGTLALSL